MSEHDQGAAAAAADTQRQRLRYLPFNEIQPGMVLGEAVTLSNRNIMRFSLPAGHELSEDNVRQLAIHCAEFVCVALPDTRSEKEIAYDAEMAAARVQRTFSGANLSQPALAALYQCMLAFRSR